MSDRRRTARPQMAPAPPRPGLLAFTLVEVLLAVVLFALLIGVVSTMARQFLFQFLWSGEVFTGVHEAATIQAAVRHDAMRVLLNTAGTDLAITLAGPSVVLGTAGGDIQYRFDAVGKVIWRQPPGGPALALGQGLVSAFDITRIFVHRTTPGPVYALATATPAGEQPYKAGLRVHLTLATDPVAGLKTSRAIELTTHVFPVFANKRLVSLWKEP